MDIRNYYILLAFLIGLFCFFQNSCQEANVTISANQKTLPEVVDFNFHIKPILSDRCFKCHGPDEKTTEGGLRLDTKERAFGALGKAKDRYAVVPHKVAESTLIDRIFTTNPDDIMPPSESNLTLDEYEKQLLKKWIKQGAEWKEHWSFLPVEKPELPTVKNTIWASNEIDYFILNKF